MFEERDIVFASAGDERAPPAERQAAQVRHFHFL